MNHIKKLKITLFLNLTYKQHSKQPLPMIKNLNGVKKKNRRLQIVN